MGTPTPSNPLAAAPTPPGADVRERLVLMLAKLMATYGIPAHRLEEAAAGCARYLGLEAQFFATPTAVFASIGGEDGSQRTHLLRLEPGEVNLEKQALVDGVLRDVLAGAADSGAALGRLEEVVRLPARFGPAVVVGAQAVASANAAVFFGGGWREVLAAAIVGLVVGLLGILASRVRRMARLVDFAAGLAAAVLAFGLAGVLQPLAPTMVVLAGVIVLVPGLTLTTAVTELATRNLAAGTARLMGALTVLISIGFGVGVGQRLGAEVFGVVGGPPQTLGELSHAASLAVAPLALAVLFQARPRDWMVIAPAGWIGYLGARVGGGVAGTRAWGVPRRIRGGAGLEHLCETGGSALGGSARPGHHAARAGKPGLSECDGVRRGEHTGGRGLRVQHAARGHGARRRAAARERGGDAAPGPVIAGRCVATSCARRAT
ncbi:MAG: threonine/serine exporter family protein [Phycisphaerales bacterium]|nr:threonine/serine exporter family protein [Phycisphaerales bacterium]